jgi:hypothetical protein
LREPVDVILLNVPVALWARTDDHARRVDAALAARDDDVARRLTAILARIGSEHMTLGESAKAELDAASARRSETVDLAYPVPERASGDFEELEAAYDAADADARARGDHDLVWPPECVAFRRWYLREIATQAKGGFPTAWDAGGY